jgi:hypothetical protein
MALTLGRQPQAGNLRKHTTDPAPRLPRTHARLQITEMSPRPAPTERLAQLRAQRANIAAHLAWLDTEIASTEHDAGAPARATLGTAALSLRVPATPILAASAPAPHQEAIAGADEIIAQYAHNDRLDPQTAKRGCIYLALGVFALFAAIILIIYFIGYHGKTPGS